MALPATTPFRQIAACSAAAAAAGGGRAPPFALAGRGGMLVGGHRGMGMNAVGSAPPPAWGARERENTLLSFGRAAQHAAVAFVEFDVQVTKDGCPIIFHDDFILTKEAEAVSERRVTDLLLEEFLSYGPQKKSHKVSKPLLRQTGDGRVLDWSSQEDDSLCTLQEVFERVNPRLGFNIELKFDDNLIYQRRNLDRALQAVLQVVSEYASNRPIFFSTFHPDAARLMRELQSLYPVFFLTEGGTAKHNDPRRNSVDEAIRVCQEYDLHGVVSEVRGVLKNPSAVRRAQELNLALLTYGQLNNVWEAVYVQYLKHSMSGNGIGLEGVRHQAFSQQQLGFLLRLIRILEQHVAVC